MKYTLTVEGADEDFQCMREFLAVREFISANEEAREMIRSRLKHGQDADWTRDRMEVFLEDLRSVLYVNGIES